MRARARSNLRIFFIGGYIAYKALFNWMHPSYYLPTMLGAPLFQILFFAYIGRYTGLKDDAFFVVGNAVQLSAMAGIYGMAMTIGGERWTQTLSQLLATPASRLALFLGRSLPLIVNGMVTSVFAFAVGWWLLDFSLALENIPTLAAIVAVSAVACTAFGLLVGAIGLRARDVFFLANLAVFSLLLMCGVNIPLDAFPGWMEAISRVLPLTHGIEAAREVAAGASFADVDHLFWTELGIGAGYAALAYGLFRFFEADGRRRATLETM
ncbi:MAG: ABC transporter permease [Actinobacteria bacterium]|nr:ABC transporter permease [Actinomycetota bacterium]